MSIELKTELAKEEYVNAINEINKKYDLPLTIVELLLSGILNEVSIMKRAKVEKEYQNYENSKKDNDVKEKKENKDGSN